MPRLVLLQFQNGALEFGPLAHQLELVDLLVRLGGGLDPRRQLLVAESVGAAAGLLGLAPDFVRGAQMHDVVDDVLVVDHQVQAQHLAVDPVQVLRRRLPQRVPLHELGQDGPEIVQGALQFGRVDSEIVVQGHLDRGSLQQQENQYGMVPFFGPAMENDVADLAAVLGKEGVLVRPAQRQAVRQVQRLVDVEQQLLGDGLEHLHGGEAQLRLGAHGDELQHGQHVLVALGPVDSVPLGVLSCWHENIISPINSQVLMDKEIKRNLNT